MTHAGNVLEDREDILLATAEDVEVRVEQPEAHQRRREYTYQLLAHSRFPRRSTCRPTPRRASRCQPASSMRSTQRCPWITPAWSDGERRRACTIHDTAGRELRP